MDEFGPPHVPVEPIVPRQYHGMIRIDPADMWLDIEEDLRREDADARAIAAFKALRAIVERHGPTEAAPQKCLVCATSWPCVDYRTASAVTGWEIDWPPRGLN